MFLRFSPRGGGTIFNSSTCKLGEAVILKFQIAQHSRYVILMESLVTILGCGRIEAYSQGPAVNLVVTKFTDITSPQGATKRSFRSSTNILYKGRKH